MHIIIKGTSNQYQYSVVKNNKVITKVIIFILDLQRKCGVAIWSVSIEWRFFRICTALMPASELIEVWAINTGFQSQSGQDQIAQTRIMLVIITRFSKPCVGFFRTL